MKISVNILGYNSKKDLELCIRSVLNQTEKDIEILFIDNASKDGSADFVRENFPKVKVIENEKNLGYAGGHNVGTRKAQGEYILILNPDVILERDFIERAARVLDKNKKVGAVSGKLLRMDESGEKTNILDSTGIEIFKSRKACDRGQGRIDKDQYKKGEVFGVSGAAPFFRKKALEDTRVLGEYFDEDFFAYKEDVDLSWRMQILGWKIWYEPGAIAWHKRVAREAKGDLDTFKERQKKPKIVNYHSFKNHHLLILKNDYCSNFFLHFPWIYWYKLKMFLYALLLEQYSLSAYFEILRKGPKMMRKRKKIMQRRKLTSPRLRKWLK